MYSAATAVRDLARLHLEEYTDKVYERRNRQVKEREITVGDTVFVKAVKPINECAKFAKRWSGSTQIPAAMHSDRQGVLNTPGQL